MTRDVAGSEMLQWLNECATPAQLHDAMKRIAVALGLPPVVSHAAQRHEMLHWLDDCTTPEQLHDVVQRIARTLGFQEITLWGVSNISAARRRVPSVFRLHQLGAYWTDSMSTYAMKRGIHPAALDGDTLTSMDNWGEKRYSRDEAALHDAGGEVGLKHGITVTTTRAAHNGLTALLVGRDAEKITPSELADVESFLYLLALKLDKKIMPMLMRPVVTPPSAAVPLATDAELKVLLCVQALRSAHKKKRIEDIAQAMHLSVDTVKKHRQNLMMKFGVHSFEDVMRLAEEFKLI